MIERRPSGLREEYWANGRLHRDDDLPAVRDADGSQWWVKGLLHRDHGPARISVHGGLTEYFQHGLRHRTNGPAVIGDPVRAQEWFSRGLRHRDGDQPAVITPDGSAHYFKHGIRHRPVEHGPAVVHPDPHPTAYTQPTDHYWEHGICLQRDPATGVWAPHPRMACDDHRRRAGLPVTIHLTRRGAPDGNVSPGIALWVAWAIYSDDEPDAERMVYWTEYDGVTETPRRMRLDEHGDPDPGTLARLRELPGVRVEVESCSVRLTARPDRVHVRMDAASTLPLSVNRVCEITP